MSWENSPGCEIEGSILGNLGSLGSKIVLFVTCGSSLASNSAGENHQPLPGCFFSLKSPPVTDSRLSLMLWRGSQASIRTFSHDERVDKSRRFIAKTACSAQGSRPGLISLIVREHRHTWRSVSGQFQCSAHSHGPGQS